MVSCASYPCAFFFVSECTISSTITIRKCSTVCTRAWWITKIYVLYGKLLWKNIRWLVQWDVIAKPVMNISDNHWSMWDIFFCSLLPCLHFSLHLNYSVQSASTWVYMTNKHKHAKRHRSKLTSGRRIYKDGCACAKVKFPFDLHKWEDLTLNLNCWILCKCVKRMD